MKPMQTETKERKRTRGAGLRSFALSAMLGLAVLAGGLGSARAARAASCTDDGCQYWIPNGNVYLFCGGTWSLLDQGCFWSNNWLYCGSQWAGHYLPDQGGKGSWRWYQSVDDAWYYLFAANNAAGGWFYKPYQHSSGCGTVTSNTTTAGASSECDGVPVLERTYDLAGNCSRQSNYDYSAAATAFKLSTQPGAMNAFGDTPYTFLSPHE